MKGLGFKHHGNHPCNHGSHYGNHHGNYHDNHSNHHGNYNAEQLLFSCQFSKVSSCQVVRLSSLIQGVPKKITHFFSHLISKRNNSETVCHILLRFDVRRVPIGNSLHIKF